MYPLESARGSAGLVYDAAGDRIFAVGGRSRARNYEDSVSVLDFRAWGWMPGPSLPFALQQPATAIVDGALYVTAGVLESGSSSNAVLASHDLAGGGWVVLGTAPFGSSPAYGASSHGRFWAPAASVVWSYDPSTGAWSGPLATSDDMAWWRPRRGGGRALPRRHRRWSPRLDSYVTSDHS